MSKSKRIQEWAEQNEISLSLMTGFDDCVVGIVTRYNSDPFVVYDTNRVIKKLVSQGMTEEEAHEYHDFNQAGAYVGDSTPGFLERIK